MLKTLMVHIRGFVRESVATPLFMILEVLMEMLIPLLMKSMIDNGIENPAGADMGHIVLMGGLMLLCALLALLGGAMGGVFGAKASAGFARNLRSAMFANIQTFSFANIDKFSTAGLVTRMTTDVTNLQAAYQMILRICFRAPISLIVAMTITLMINAKLASIYLIAVAFLSVVLFFLIRKTHKYFMQVFDKYDELNASVQENVKSIRVVKAFVREHYEISKFERATLNLYTLFLKAEKLMVSVSPLMMLTIYASIIAISWFGANMVVGGELSKGDLTSMLTYCMNILMNLMMIAFIFVMLTMSTASGKRIAQVLTEKATIADPENPDCDVPDGSIDFEDVEFSYSEKSEKPVLNHIDLHIRSGETIGIIGGTGSSKTSLVNLIGRLYDVNKGCVKVGGKDVRSYDLEVLRDKERALLGHDPRQPPLGQRERHRGRMCACLSARLRRRLYPRFSRRLPHAHRAGRHERFGRSEAAPLYRQSPAEKAADLDPRRLHQRGRYRYRRQDPPRLCRGDPRYHQADHLAACVERGERRPYRRDGRRLYQRRGHPRRADAALFDLQ